MGGCREYLLQMLGVRTRRQLGVVMESGVGPEPSCARVKGSVGRGAEPRRGLAEVCGGKYVLRLVAALIHLKDGFHLGPQREALESKSI